MAIIITPSAEQFSRLDGNALVDIYRDGKQIWRGVFSLAEADRRAIHRWQDNRDGRQ